MRKIIFSMFMTLDGYVSGPDGELDWAIVDEELHRFVNQEEQGVDMYFYGRRLYETMAAYWPTAESDPEGLDYTYEYARIWNAMDKVVFSRTLQRVEWKSTLLREVDPAEIRRIQALPGKNITLGGPDLAATFLRLGLVDEVQVYIHPVLLGRGVPMFQQQEQVAKLRLLNSRKLHSGVIEARYEVQRDGQTVV